MIQPPMIQPPVIQPPVVEIKKYANRRLYDTAQSAYITVSDLAEMVASGTKIKVSDAKSGEDLTSITLLQILMEQCVNPVYYPRDYPMCCLMAVLVLLWVWQLTFLRIT